MRVLLVDDDAAIARSIELMLKIEEINVYRTDLGEEGVDLGKIYDYDIILLDLNLPDISGYEVLRSLRSAKVVTPVLILSGLASIEDKIRGLGLGADDYLSKPFHKDELIARIHALVRRSKGHAQSVITVGDLIVNLEARNVELRGQKLHLTAKEYQILALLALRIGSTLTKETFLNHLYGGLDDEPEAKIIDVFICKLRKKLANASGGQDYIETVWGRGYALREPTKASDRKLTPARSVVVAVALSQPHQSPRNQDQRRGSFRLRVPDRIHPVDAAVAVRAGKLQPLCPAGLPAIAFSSSRSPSARDGHRFESPQLLDPIEVA